MVERLLGPTSEARIAGPKEGKPGEPLLFRLMDEAAQLPVDRWEQVFNPDRYNGHNYLTSFCLPMDPRSDGSLLLTAMSPGRFRIAALRSGVRWEKELLVRPWGPPFEIRGISFIVNGVIDRAYASRMFALAQQAGVNWVSLINTGGVDLDTPELVIEAPCAWCSGTESLEDLGWLIDEAHRQGLKVALSPEVWARTATPPTRKEHSGIFVRKPMEVIGDLPPLVPLNSPLIPKLMESYQQFLIGIAKVARNHDAEALFVGNETSWWDSPLLWTERERWQALFRELRTVYKGQLWLSGVNGCSPGPGINQWIVDFLEMFDYVDGITANQLHAIKGSGPPCGWDPSGIPNPSAEYMADNIARSFPLWHAFKLGARKGLPIIWTELYPVAIDGVNYYWDAKLGLNTVAELGPQDNQELTDWFEAQMRAFSQANAMGYFIFGAGLANNGDGAFLDPVKQPALMHAIANWWGGEPALFESCLVEKQPREEIFRDGFEPRSDACPLPPLDSLVPRRGWQIVQDSKDSTNHVLQGKGSPAAPGHQVPEIGWAKLDDYTVMAKMRLSPGPQGSILVRYGADSNHYGIHFGFDQIAVIKHLNTQGRHLPLATYRVPQGTGSERWYRIDVTVVGDTVSVRLDGLQVIETRDLESPLTTGGVRLSVGSGLGPGIVEFDDVVVVREGG